jgi:class 3 adenylate cyclase
MIVGSVLPLPMKNSSWIELPPARQSNFRIGVHVGDVMVKAGDLLGDGVSIAARLQTMADPRVSAFPVRHMIRSAKQRIGCL